MIKFLLATTDFVFCLCQRGKFVFSTIQYLARSIYSKLPAYLSIPGPSRDLWKITHSRCLQKVECLPCLLSYNVIVLTDQSKAFSKPFLSKQLVDELRVEEERKEKIRGQLNQVQIYLKGLQSMCNTTPICREITGRLRIWPQLFI
jgi:hypothetical protein